MKLYNTLTKQIDLLEPLDRQTYRVYSCGPTVYDHVHIGNLSSFVFADTLRRALQLTGKSVTHVMNYTDVDDKTIRRSLVEYSTGEPRQRLRQLTDKYIATFAEDMKKIGNNMEDMTFIRATDPETIKGMQQLVSDLHAQGFAYIADDGIYFSIDAYRKSGKIYGQLLALTAQNTSDARIQNDEYDKESIHDFALWKKQKGEEPAWAFELDGQDLTGRPGWHIECSTMSRQSLGQPFDIHTGGIDLIFPHHENEIAQSTALEADPSMATFFAHNEHILVDGKKMSKSAQNFFTLHDIIDKGFHPLAFRLLVLQANYRSQVNFSWESLLAAQNRLYEIWAWADLRWQTKTNIMPEELDNLFHTTRQDIQAAIENDLSTPVALAALGKLMNYMQNIAIPGVEGKYTDGTLAFLDQVFGLDLANRHDITDDQKQLIVDRQAARDAKDWSKSDAVRLSLLQQNITVRDTPHGPIWARIAPHVVATSRTKT